MTTLHRFAARGRLIVITFLALAGAALAAAQSPSNHERGPGARVSADAAVALPPVAREQEPEYVGSRACRRCHLREHRSWQGTAHANIFELLEPGVRAEAKQKVNLQPDADYRTNELCLQCHTVGYGTPSGFKSLEETPDLTGVGCETCHGPGSAYIRDDVMGNDNLDHSFEEVIAAGLIYPVPEEVCRQCHTNPATPFNPELFPEYDFEYTRETVEAGSHDHFPLGRDHGPLPPGVMFQESALNGSTPLPRPPLRGTLLPGARTGVPAFEAGFEEISGGRLWAHTSEYSVELTEGVARLMRAPRGGGPPDELVMRLVGARPVSPVGEQALAGAANYLRGADPVAWRLGVPRFGSARFASAYAGIDWTCRIERGRLAYDFVVAPGAEPGDIRIRMGGAAGLRVGTGGELRVSFGGRELVHAAPFAFQPGADGRQPVAVEFVVHTGANEVGFRLGDYDRERELVIDPAIGFSSYLGGMASEDLPRVALGPDGGVVVVGTTASPDLPVAVAGGATPAEPRLAGEVDVFVAKLAPDGTTLEFLTYFGGSGMDRAGDVAVADDGSVWISGQTSSPDLAGGEGDVLAGPADAFVARLSKDGEEVLTSRLIGGRGVEAGTGIALDGTGSVYLTGSTNSDDFVTVGVPQQTLGGPGDAFAVRLDPTGRETLYARYLGGADGDDTGFAIAADPAGNAYVTGSTESADFPRVRPAQPEFGGSRDAFLAKLTPAGEVAYATTLGGDAADAGLAVAVDASGAAYVTGQTESASFPTRRPIQQLPGGGPDAFVTKIGADGLVVYSTFLGGEGVDVGGGIAVDGTGNAHVTGMTSSPDFPVAQTLQPYFGGGADVFVLRINDLGTALTYGTFSGGAGADAGIDIVVDGVGNAYVVGQTSSRDFPTFNAVQDGLRGPQDAFVTKYCLSLVFPDERTLASQGGGESFAVTTPAGCVWIAFSQADWISLTTPNVVAGPSEVLFEATPNGTGAPRSGIINIAGAEVTVTQAPATDCEYTISPQAENFYMVGGVGRINVDTRDDCAWSAVSNETWISISGMDHGTGPGVVSYTVEANRTGRQRSGTITVAGHSFVVFDWLR